MKINKKSLLMHPVRVFLARFLHIHTLLITTCLNKKREKIENANKTLITSM